MIQLCGESARRHLSMTDVSKMPTQWRCAFMKQMGKGTNCKATLRKMLYQHFINFARVPYTSDSAASFYVDVFLLDSSWALGFGPPRYKLLVFFPADISSFPFSAHSFQQCGVGVIHPLPGQDSFWSIYQQGFKAEKHKKKGSQKVVIFTLSPIIMEVENHPK